MRRLAHVLGAFSPQGGAKAQRSPCRQRSTLPHLSSLGFGALIVFLLGANRLTSLSTITQIGGESPRFSQFLEFFEQAGFRYQVAAGDRSSGYLPGCVLVHLVRRRVLSRAPVPSDHSIKPIVENIVETTCNFFGIYFTYDMTRLWSPQSAMSPSA